MPPKKALFDNDSDDDGGLKINKNYAEHYQNFRSKELYQTLKARNLLEESSSSEEEEKDYDKPFNPEFDKEFLLSLGTLYSKKDEDLKKVKFFEGDYRVEKEKEDKPMTLKDYETRRLMREPGEYDDDRQMDYNNRGFSPESSKAKFDDGLDDSGDEDDDEGLLGSGLFKRKDNDDDSIKVRQNSAIDYVKGKTTTPPVSNQEDVLKNLKDVWNSKDLSKKDKWLVNFFMKEKYLAEDSDYSADDSSSSDEEEIPEEEEEDKKLNPLAAKHKYRHQESGQFIKSFPRGGVKSVRSKDETRKQKREAAKLRAEKKKEEKREEIELLKALKLKEIQDKIARIKEASGNDDIDLGAVNLLDEDFDPAAHDAKMEQVFGDSYYDDDNAEAELPAFEDEMDDTKIYENWTEQSGANGYEDSDDECEEEREQEEEGRDHGEEGGEHEEEGGDNWTGDCEHNGDFNMDADYDPSTAQETKKKFGRTRRKVKKSNVQKVLEKKKPLFDPSEKDYAAYYDEYYQLDFEDIVSGIPCRFKYRNVEPNNFGLTTEEILSAETSDLNKWVGMKKLIQYDRTAELEKIERLKYTRRAEHDHVKQKILPSLYVENPEETMEKVREKNRQRNLKRKENRRKMLLAMENGTHEDVKSDFDSKSENAEKSVLGTESIEEENNEDQMGEESPMKSKHKKKKNIPLETPTEESPTESKPKKKKKREAEVTEESPAEGKTKKRKKREDEAIEESPVESKPEKRKKKKGEVTEESPVESIPEKRKKKKGEVIEESSAESKPEKRKKKKGEVTEESSTESKPEKKKKKKGEAIEELSAESKPEKRKKKKGDATEESPAEGKIKQRKKKEGEPTEESPADSKPEEKKEGEATEESPAKSKKKKKKKKNRKRKIPVSKDQDVANLMSSKEVKALKSRERFLLLKKYKKEKKLEPYFGGVSDTRLAAYGEAPRIMKRRALYHEFNT